MVEKRQGEVVVSEELGPRKGSAPLYGTSRDRAATKVRGTFQNAVKHDDIQTVRTQPSQFCYGSKAKLKAFID